MAREQVLGHSREEKRIVLQEDTAKVMGSGDLDVYATPAMVAFMEYTSKELLKEILKENETTVGIRMDVRHLKPTNIGSDIRAVATATQVDEGKITLQVDVFEKDVLIGTGLHVRFIVDKNTFGQK